MTIGPPHGAILTAAEMRAVEQAAFTDDRPSSYYMDKAGKAVADLAWRVAAGSPILILCGPGNNGGDGYIAAHYLASMGADVRVVAVLPPKSEGALWARGFWYGPVEMLAMTTSLAPIVIDAIFGTGARGGLDLIWGPMVDRLIRDAERSIAVDLPSSLNSDDPMSGDTVAVDITLALGALKRVHVLGDAASRCGLVLLDTLGLAPNEYRFDAPWVMPEPVILPPDSKQHKYSRGMVAVIAGVMPGAAALAVGAAVRSEAGYGVLVGASPTDDVPKAVVQKSYDDLPALLSDERLAALVIGPGLGRNGVARNLLAQALASGKPLVIDGDALHLLDTDIYFDQPVILTPHHGEFVALFGELEGDKCEKAKAAAQRCNAVIIFKGPDTIIATPDGGVWVAPRASSWLASAGTGDVLAGLCGASLAVNPEFPLNAAQTAVWLHGEAARLAGPALIADDLIDQLPRAVQRALA